MHYSKILREKYPWTAQPLIVGAPMRVMAGPDLAVAISQAGGLGFIGPGTSPESTAADLESAKARIQQKGGKESTGSGILPVGVGFLLWAGDVNVACAAIKEHRPAAAWLYAAPNGQADIDTWTEKIRQTSPETQIWLQVGTLREALDAAHSPQRPDVLVIQGNEAGGHGRATDSIGIISLLPEVSDTLQNAGISIPLVAAGGIADGRGVAAALSLGASGAVMGTRFLASEEARIKPGYQKEVVRATDGGANTARTLLYNHLNGIFGWPAAFSPRVVTNKSWEDHQAGVPFEELEKRHAESLETGEAAWGPEGRAATYAGASVGLVRSVESAGTIVEQTKSEAKSIIQSLQGFANE